MKTKHMTLFALAALGLSVGFLTWSAVQTTGVQRHEQLQQAAASTALSAAAEGRIAELEQAQQEAEAQQNAQTEQIAQLGSLLSALQARQQIDQTLLQAALHALAEENTQAKQLLFSISEDSLDAAQRTQYQQLQKQLLQ